MRYFLNISLAVHSISRLTYEESKIVIDASMQMVTILYYMRKNNRSTSQINSDYFLIHIWLTSCRYLANILLAVSLYIKYQNDLFLVNAPRGNRLVCILVVSFRAVRWFLNGAVFDGIFIFDI